MIPRRTARAVLMALLLVPFTDTSTHAAPVDEPKSKARPNFVLCMADDQGWGEVGYRPGGAPVETPALDEMAANGLRLDRFHAAAPVCSPTRGSVMTGRHPNRFGDFKWGYTLRPQEVTVAEVLRKAGYATGHFGKWHLGSMRADSPTSPGNSGFETWLSSPNFYDNSPLLSRNGTVVPTEGESSMVIVDAALDFIRDAKQDDRPFLAVVWFGSPHLPHQADPSTREPYAELPPAVQNYYGEITGIDRAMGRLRTQLRAQGLADETLVWYTSDNGPKPPKGDGRIGIHRWPARAQGDALGRGHPRPLHDRVAGGDPRGAGFQRPLQYGGHLPDPARSGRCLVPRRPASADRRHQPATADRGHDD